MKKIYSLILAAAAILSAASCQSKLEDESVDNNGGKFTIIASAADTKTTLAEDGLNILWKPGDKITVFDAAGQPVVFTTNITEPAAKAEFSAESFNAPRSLVAVYNPTRNATLENDKIYPLRVGGDQTPYAGTFDPNAAVAIGTSKRGSSNEIAFKNIHSLVKFTVGEQVPSKVKLVNNGGAILVGLMYWNTATSAIEHSGAGESSITLSGKFEKGKTYYIAVTPNEAKGGLSLYFDDVLVKNTGKDITLQPNTIYNLGTLPEEKAVDIDKKQWEFTWKKMHDWPSVLDLGVTTPGQAIIAYDDNGSMTSYIAADYTITPTDATSGVITLTLGSLVKELTYSEATETSVHISGYVGDLDCTLATSKVNIIFKD